MSRNDAWMPLDVGDYLGDTMHLTTVQHGAYFLLLVHYWRNGPLPNDYAKLSAITKMSAPEMRKMTAVMDFFSIGTDGLLHQKRADKERQKREQISSKRAAAAHAMHEQTASKRGANAPANATTRAGGLHLQSKEGSPLTPVNGNRVSDPLGTGMADLGMEDGRPTCGGYFVDSLFDDCCAAAKISTVSTIATWQPLIGWLKDGYPETEILQVIRRLAGRSDYKPPRTLAYFNKAIREDGKKAGRSGLFAEVPQ